MNLRYIKNDHSIWAQCKGNRPSERRSREEKAAETFFSRKVVVKHLRKNGIVLRAEDRRKTGSPPFGVRRRRYRVQDILIRL